MYGVHKQRDEFMTKNNINPKHYQQGRISNIEFIEDRLGTSGFKAFLLGSHYKYTYRFKHKHKHLPTAQRKEKELEDLKKSQWYLARYQMCLQNEIKSHTEANNVTPIQYDSNDLPSDTEHKNENE